MAITINGNGITSANIADGTITNADINASAAIDASKLTGTGKVLQVVQGSTNTQAGMGGTSFADTGLTASITPTSTSSKILVIINQYYTFRVTSTENRTAYFRLVGLSGVLVQQLYTKYNANSSNEDQEGKMACFNYLDSPNTTSSVTYKTQFRLNNSASDLYAQHNGTTSFITLVEIAG